MLSIYTKLRNVHTSFIAFLLIVSLVFTSNSAHAMEPPKDYEAFGLGLKMFGSINERLKRIKQETWQPKLIRNAYAHKTYTVLCLAMGVPVVIGIILIKILL